MLLDVPPIKSHSCSFSLEVHFTWLRSDALGLFIGKVYTRKTAGLVNTVGIMPCVVAILNKAVIITIRSCYERLFNAFSSTWDSYFPSFIYARSNIA
jgi:hypothetical protein